MTEIKTFESPAYDGLSAVTMYDIKAAADDGPFDRAEGGQVNAVLLDRAARRSRARPNPRSLYPGAWRLDGRRPGRR